MLLEESSHVRVEQHALPSVFLKRHVLIDCYIPREPAGFAEASILLLNDGQDMEEMGFLPMLEDMLASEKLRSLFCVCIHAGKDRRSEYGTVCRPDYAGRGAKSLAYSRFIMEELLPFLYLHFSIKATTQKGIAGFSLGGLSALDITWNHPQVFSLAGVFSGSLWWRSKSLEDNYDDDRDRIMHQQVRNGVYRPGLRFYFTTGSLDETADRNNNGIIDSIDDTLDLIRELEQKGYEQGKDIYYGNDENGKHDVATWGRAMPGFLLWAFGRNQK